MALSGGPLLALEHLSLGFHGLPKLFQHVLAKKLFGRREEFAFFFLGVVLQQLFHDFDPTGKLNGAGFSVQEVRDDEGVDSAMLFLGLVVLFRLFLAAGFFNSRTSDPRRSVVGMDVVLREAPSIPR